MLDGFLDVLKSGRPVITCELNPPKGVALGPLFKKTEALKGLIDAFNIPDSSSSIMAMAPMSVAHLLNLRDIDTIIHVTGRDRNQIAIQSDLLACHALGVTNLLCLSGDPPGAGDHPKAKPVFDLNATEILKAANALSHGRDLSGNSLKGTPKFQTGAAANPGAPDLPLEIQRMEEKIAAGASFFQTQAAYDPFTFERFAKATQNLKVPILAGLIVLKSGNMARNLNANLPGLLISDNVIEELDASNNKPQTSVEVSARIIKQIKGMFDGIHIMAIGWENLIPEILETAGFQTSAQV